MYLRQCMKPLNLWASNFPWTAHVFLFSFIMVSPLNIFHILKICLIYFEYFEYNIYLVYVKYFKYSFFNQRVPPFGL